MAITLSTDGYCAAADVAALVQEMTIDANSDPSTTEVEGFITQYFGEIGGMLVGANYAHPVSQAGGSLAVSAGNIVTSGIFSEGDTYLILIGSGGTLTGVTGLGDWLTISGDSQRYMVFSRREVDDDNEITFDITPPLEKRAASGAVVTYTAAAGGANVLKNLNAHGAAVMTVRAAYGPDADDAIVGPLVAERDRLFNAISGGAIVLLGADKVSQTQTIGSARLLRA
jgi:hypothetical protein